jgi:hypothetical protein
VLVHLAGLHLVQASGSLGLFWEMQGWGKEA